MLHSFQKIFSREDNYGMRSKLSSDITYGSYKNQQENIHFIHEMPTKQEVAETSELVETCLPSAPTPQAEKIECKPKKRKAKHKCDTVAKITLKKRNEEKS